MSKVEPNTVAEVEINRISDGLGFGDGQISSKTVENQSDNEDLAVLTDEAIKATQILAPISRDSEGRPVTDDGCGDGRNVMQRFGAIFSKSKQFAKSLFRPKVFGGGATMAAAMRIGLGEAKQTTLQQVFQDAINQLGENGLDFGAHIDNHAHGEATGCGAIDKAPLIIPTAVKYKQQIKSAIEALGFSTAGLDEVFESFTDYSVAIADQPFSGRLVIDEIIDKHKIIKELADEHRESRIVLNFVAGFTVNQQYVRNRTGDRAHIFAVDIWRLQQLAEGLWRSPNDRQQAVLSALVYTLATAAVLTKGDLPVYTIRPKESLGD